MSQDILDRFRPLFYPRGVIMTGVSQHPGKFGSVALHNLIRFGYQGEIFGINREGLECYGHRTYTAIGDVPKGRADLAFICTPAKINPDLLRQCHDRGVRAAFVASGGYAEGGPDGVARQRELIELADELGITLAGPNGQGLISTPVSMCAQITAPFPPPGPISAVSQSGNLATSFMNYGVLSGIGFSKVVSAGNSAQLGIADYLEYFAVDPETEVSLVYMENLDDGRRFLDAARAHTAKKPLVVLRGGTTDQGTRAASSHTGALASNARVFDGACRQAGITRATTLEEAYETAASFAVQPLPRGRRTLVFTVAGGWGVLTSDAIALAGLELIPLPDDLKSEIDKLVPPLWSKNNPIDLAGGETRDTIPQVLELAASHSDVDAIVYLGIGTQDGQGQAFRSGKFYPDHGLDRMAGFHQRQDLRYGTAAAEASAKHGKPILIATDLVYTDREYGNAGPTGVKQSGRLCYQSGHRAVRVLSHMVRYSEFLQRRA